jgi:hypothetical protein
MSKEVIMRSLTNNSICPRTGTVMTPKECWLCISCDSAYYENSDKERPMVKCSYEKEEK